MGIMYFEMLARCGGKRLHAIMHPSTTLKKFQADLFTREGKGNACPCFSGFRVYLMSEYHHEKNKHK
jgi:hypothetical protein